MKAGLPRPWEGQNEAGSEACLLWSSAHQFLVQFFDRICLDQGGRGFIASLLRDGLHDVMEVVLSLDFALDKSWYVSGDSPQVGSRQHGIQPRGPERAGSPAMGAPPREKPSGGVCSGSDTHNSMSSEVSSPKGAWPS